VLIKPGVVRPEASPLPSPSPEAAQAAVAAGLRDLSEPEAPSPRQPTEGTGGVATPTGRWRDALRFAGPLVVLTLGLKAMIFALGIVVIETLSDRTFATVGERFSFWNAWDAPHYLDIAADGYQTTGDAANFIVFFPGYPLAMRTLDVVVPGDLLAAAFVLSGVASVAAAVLLGLLARYDGADEAQATRAVWFLLIFPTAYFLHIPYTESLFLSLVLGAFLAARTGHWATAGLVGMLAAATRVNGMILLPALMVEAYLQYRQGRRIERAWLWIAAIPLGFAAYLAINQAYFGDAFHFQDVQREHWVRFLQDPVTSVTGMVESAGGRKPGELQMSVIQELLFLGIGLAAGLAALRWCRPSYAVWTLLNVLLFASTSWIQSTPRYAITLFPIFLLLASATKRPWIGMLLSAWSLAMLAWFTTKFALGHWAF
jgi:Mannosyltransferase (PIG-V)